MCVAVPLFVITCKYPVPIRVRRFKIVFQRANNGRPHFPEELLVPGPAIVIPHLLDEIEVLLLAGGADREYGHEITLPAADVLCSGDEIQGVFHLIVIPAHFVSIIPAIDLSVFRPFHSVYKCRVFVLGPQNCRGVVDNGIES